MSIITYPEKKAAKKEMFGGASPFTDLLRIIFIRYNQKLGLIVLCLQCTYRLTVTPCMSYSSSLKQLSMS